MNAKLRLVSFGIVGFGLLATAAGCKVTVQSQTRFNGTPIQQDVAWTSGQALTIESPNGDVSVKADAPDGHITVKAKPFAFADDDDESGAQSTMNGKLAFKAFNDNGAVVLQGIMQGSGSYGFDIEVHVPAGFNGALDVEQENGAVDLHGTGPASQTKVVSNNGSITATDQTLGQSIYLTTQNGSIEVNGAPTGTGNVVHTDNGFVTFGVGTGANVAIHAIASTGTVHYPDGWAVTGETASDVTITVGDGSAQLEVSTGNGDVTIQ